MGACHIKRSIRQSNQWRFSERLTSQRLDFIFQRLSLYLELVGDTHSLGGYLQDKINELFQIKQELTLVKDHLKKIELLSEASDVIEYLQSQQSIQLNHTMINTSAKLSLFQGNVYIVNQVLIFTFFCIYTIYIQFIPQIIRLYQNHIENIKENNKALYEITQLTLVTE